MEDNDTFRSTDVHHYDYKDGGPKHSKSVEVRSQWPFLNLGVDPNANDPIVDTSVVNNWTLVPP